MAFLFHSEFRFPRGRALGNAGLRGEARRLWQGAASVNHTRLRDYVGTIGIRGDLSGRNIDFSAGRGRNTFDYEVHDTVNASFGPQTGSYPVNQIYLPYSIFSPFGFNGRYAYGRIAMNF